jgi:tetratricopeptide (TPR) repeat protein
MLGVIAHSRGDFVEAEKLFLRAVEINPNYTEAQLNLMVTCNELGKYDVARKIYSQVRHKSGSGPGKTDPFARGKIANMHAATGQAYLDAGMLPDSIKELEKAVQLCPTFADLRTKLAQLYRDAGDDARAMAQLEAAKDTNPKYVNARLLLGVLCLGRGDTARATEEFQQVLALEPKNQRAEMYLRLAENQRSLSDSPAHESKAPPSE